MNAYKNIERYIQGDLRQKEAKEFAHDLENNSHLLREYQLRRDIDEALKEDDVMELRDQMQDVMKEKQSNPVRWFRRKTAMAVVAAVLMISLGSVGYYYYQVNHSLTTDKIFQEYYQPYEATITIRSGAEREVNDLLSNALQRYKQQDYQTALQLFQKVLKQREDVAASLYSGISFMEIEKYGKANQSFDKVVENKNNLFLYQAKWYMSMCYIKLNKKQKALSVLEELSAQSDYYHKKSEEVAKKLKRIN